MMLLCVLLNYSRNVFRLVSFVGCCGGHKQLFFLSSHLGFFNNFHNGNLIKFFVCLRNSESFFLNEFSLFFIRMILRRNKMKISRFYLVLKEKSFILHHSLHKLFTSHYGISFWHICVILRWKFPYEMM